jgi:hypothetical protein
MQLSGVQDFNFPMSLEDFGEHFADKGLEYRYDILNGFHRFFAAQKLIPPVHEYFCNIFSHSTLDDDQRLLLCANKHAGSKPSSLGHIIKLLEGSFRDITEPGLMGKFAQRLCYFMSKEPPASSNWANKHWLVVKFPLIDFSREFK